MLVMYRRIVLQTAINNRDMGLINSDHFRSLLFQNCVHPTESPLFVVFSCKFVEEYRVSFWNERRIWTSYTCRRFSINQCGDEALISDRTAL